MERLDSLRIFCHSGIIACFRVETRTTNAKRTAAIKCIEMRCLATSFDLRNKYEVIKFSLSLAVYKIHIMYIRIHIIQLNLDAKYKASKNKIVLLQ